MTFDILQHLDKLEPDGGSNDPRGDHSYLCPVCGAENFKVNIISGKWSTYGCECALTENGKRQIRHALSPAASTNNPTKKEIRPQTTRSWKYFTPITLQRNEPALVVHRTDDGKGKRKIWQSSLIDGFEPAQIKEKVLPYGLTEALQALKDGAPHIFWVEGESCVDALRALGLPAVTSIGGAGKFKPERDGGHIPGDRLVVVPDRDKHGIKYAEDVAAAHPGCQWLFPFPGAPQWNGSMPATGGLDIADWIQLGATVETILKGIGPRPEPALPQLFSQASEALTIDDLLGPVQEGKLRRPRTDQLTKLMSIALPLRFNLLTQRIENGGSPIDGDFLGTLYMQLAERFQVEVAKDRASDAAMLQARRNAFHPVRDYLSGISTTLYPEQWESIANHIFGLNDPIASLHFRRQLIGLVARALKPGCKLDTSLVIQSPQQGIGKSTMWSILGGSWFSDSLGDLRNLKDDVLQLHSAWIHEWGEIDSVMGKRESETLKKFLSATKDDVRKPYGRGVETLVRSCGIVGTTNRSDFIKDPTGNRRFPVISVDQVNVDWVQQHRDQIWGSALADFNAGSQWHYDAIENTAITEHARNYAAEDPLRDQLETWIEDNPSINKAPVARIVFDINREKLGDQEFSRQISLRLTSFGWAKSKTRERGYLPDGSRHDKATHWTAPVNDDTAQ